MISSINTSSVSQNLGVSTSDSSASRRAATESAAQPVQTGGATFDPNFGSPTEVKISAFEQATVTYRPSEAYIASATSAGDDMKVIQKELGKIDALVAKRRPDIGSNWDFKLVNGKFKVTGLDANDAKWVEGKLNGNSALVTAANAYFKTAVSALQTSGSNPARMQFNLATGQLQNYTFYNVKDQLTDKLEFRSLLRQSDAIVDTHGGDVPSVYRGQHGLSVTAMLLTPSNEAIKGQETKFFATKYDPLQP